MLNKPADVAETVVFALTQPPGCELRELVVAASTECSWPSQASTAILSCCGRSDSGDLLTVSPPSVPCGAPLPDTGITLATPEPLRAGWHY